MVGMGVREARSRSGRDVFEKIWDRRDGRGRFAALHGVGVRIGYSMATFVAVDGQETLISRGITGLIRSSSMSTCCINNLGDGASPASPALTRSHPHGLAMSIVS